MRGGAQAHLLEAGEGNYFVVKFKNNPQHLRVLVNELICSTLLRYLQITTPQTTIIETDEAFLEANPDAHIQLGSRHVPVEPGWHFGSAFPGDPYRLVVWDFVPDKQLLELANPGDFLGAFVFDRWTGNVDGRQAIFYRATMGPPPEEGRSRGFAPHVALMVDHGFAFGGPYWRFGDSPLHGVYRRPVVYRGVTGLESLQPWLDRVRHLPEAVVDQALKQVPLEWLPEGTGELEGMLLKLLDRRSRIDALVEDCCLANREKAFRDWR